ncbi:MULTISPECIES: DUF1450 domain-containing protein [Aneurinibacillus]|jgi:uncharacterized protein YuzB (UPF0349 family)|uniref:DUF1450 domain-containing protein n=1 Tax=Aneurinibacillus danicus TaxID=267746 RepID=A0A511V6T6_9BACL|nr:MULTISPECIES: DUF1450 domain-containing protein [Aneurinibacillus]GEN33423.1 hypothetical protein ADA01nite_08830 [Aneurinibacillus danicus]
MSNKIKVEFCQSNMSRHASSRDAFAFVKEHAPADAVDVVEMKCGGICVACKMSPYALINKKYVTALDADEFFQRFKKELEKQTAADTTRKAI